MERSELARSHGDRAAAGDSQVVDACPNCSTLDVSTRCQGHDIVNGGTTWINAPVHVPVMPAVTASPTVVVPTPCVPVGPVIANASEVSSPKL